MVEDKKHYHSHGTGRTDEYTSRRNRKCVTHGYVHQYNKYTGGFDLSDMNLLLSRKENHKVEFKGLLSSIWSHLNALLVYERNTSSRPLVYQKFLECC